MKRIYPSVYAYKGYIVDGQYAKETDWKISIDGEWEVSLSTKRECKDWIDQRT